ncbi:MAG: hypothetical protein FWG75_09385 [Cystobacterineae bacterium]|nr:hypothetical protein [Cystobacterineae bacterium]
MKLQPYLRCSCLGLLAFLFACNNAPSTPLVCPPDAVQCGNHCALLESDVDHCGGCNQACNANQRCVDNQCREVHCEEESHLYAACFQTGQVSVLSTCTQSRFHMALVGDRPQAINGMGEVLLVADDGTEQLLRLNPQSLEPIGEAVSIGQTPIHVSADGTHAYVINAGSHTLQVVEGGSWQTIAELPFGDNTSPQAFALVGKQGFVPLYGNLVTGETSAGQKLVRINLENPAAPVRAGEVDFSSLSIPHYEGMAPLPLPYDVLHHQGALYVALNNLNAYYMPAGPGLIAKVDPQTLATSLLSLGDTCTNVSSLASNGKLLAASCAGDWGMSPGIAGVALIINEEVKTWPAPPSFSAGAMAFSGDMLWVANANGGDVYVFSTKEGGLHLLRGEGGSEGEAIATCPPGPTGYTTVQSLWLKP